jgi:hypothetical protein
MLGLGNQAPREGEIVCGKIHESAEYPLWYAWCCLQQFEIASHLDDLHQEIEYSPEPSYDHWAQSQNAPLTSKCLWCHPRFFHSRNWEQTFFLPCARVGIISSNCRLANRRCLSSFLTLMLKDESESKKLGNISRKSSADFIIREIKFEELNSRN